MRSRRVGIRVSVHVQRTGLWMLQLLNLVRRKSHKFGSIFSSPLIVWILYYFVWIFVVIVVSSCMVLRIAIL